MAGAKVLATPLRRVNADIRNRSAARPALEGIVPVKAPGQVQLKVQQTAELGYRLTGKNLAGHAGMDKAAVTRETTLVACRLDQRQILWAEIPSAAKRVGKPAGGAPQAHLQGLLRLNQLAACFLRADEAQIGVADGVRADFMPEADHPAQVVPVEIGQVPESASHSNTWSVPTYRVGTKNVADSPYSPSTRAACMLSR